MASTLKGTGYFKNQDFTKEILIKRKENLKKLNEMRDEGKYAVLFYKKVVWREKISIQRRLNLLNIITRPEIFKFSLP